jgi:hypothetical protein
MPNLTVLPDAPDAFAVAPLDEGWTIVRLDTTQRLDLPALDLGAARFWAAAMTFEPSFAGQLAWVAA